MSDEVTIKQETQGNEEDLRPGRTFVPNVEIRETDEALWLWADLPGVDEKSVDVRIENNVLMIHGEVGTDDYSDLSPVYTEYNVGSFRRSFQIASAIDSDKISAKMRNGVLELQIHKAEEAKPQQIPIAVQ